MLERSRILNCHYLHFVWSTRQRAPLLVDSLEKAVYSYIVRVCEDDGCELLAIGGMSDHVHLLVNFSNTCTVAAFVQHVKGGSSRLINKTLAPDANFAWQKGYAVFSIRKGDIGATRAYILDQKNRHSNRRVWSSLEALCPDDDV